MHSNTTAVCSNSSNPSFGSTRTHEFLKIAHLNINSLRHKKDHVSSLLNNHEIHILGLSETKLDGYISDGELSIPSYRLLRKDRTEHGGGVAFYVAAHLHIERDDDIDHNEIESIWIRVFLNGDQYQIGTIYRPPSQKSGYWQTLEQCWERMPSIPTIIVGDFNADALNKNDAGWKKLSLVSAGVGLRNCINEPTRICPSSSTCLDLLLTNLDESPACEVIETHISDHQMIIGSVPVKVVPHPCSPLQTTRDLKRIDMAVFLDLLRQKSLSSFRSLNNVDEMWSEWHSKFLSVLDVCAPSITKRVRKKTCPWMNTELRKLIHRRKWLYKRLKRCNFKDSSLFRDYRKLRNAANNQYRRLKNEYFSTQCAKYRKNPSAVWKAIKFVTGKVPHAKTCNLIQAEDLNSYFGNLVSSPKNTHGLLIPHGPPTLDALTNFSVVTVDTVERHLTNLDGTKASGPDDISPWILKAAAPSLATSLTLLFNCSLRSGTFPKAFKLANITPVLKPNKNPALEQSYRGISLTPVISKILEAIVREQISFSFEWSKLFHNQQYGFCPRRNCEDLLLASVDKWQTALDDGKSVVVAFLDISKAFDNVNHQTVLLDLARLNFAGSVLKWFSSYLSHRFQRVVVNGRQTDFIPLEKGVPQGSILAPLLFNIYVAHLPDLVSSQQVEMPSYADDLTLYSIANSLEAAASAVSEATDLVTDDLSSRDLFVNASKSCAMFLGRGSGAAESLSELRCKNFSLTPVTNTKLLGVVIDNKLNWDEHLRQTITKVGRKIGAFRRAQRLLSVHARKMFLASVVLPDLDYCCPVFASALRAESRRKLELLERKALRICAGAGREDPCGPIYNALGIMPLCERWLLRVLCATFQAIKGDRPPAVNNLFKDNQHTLYRTRSGCSNALLPRRPLRRIGHTCYAFRASVLWNALPSNCRLASSVMEFKKSLFVICPAKLNELLSIMFDVLPA